jgi:hypothetical protein
MDKENCFVFVVCGTEAHIETLHFSLERLKKYSQAKIIILTDSSRNELEISHDNIVDIATNVKMNHHQASIFLKTGIHQFLPVGPTYCYLDTDVVALSEEINAIFQEYQAPITFAPDHCKMLKFSSYSVHCGCKEKWDKKRGLFETASLKWDKNRSIKDPRILTKQKRLSAHFDKLKKDFFTKAYTALRYVLSFKNFQLNEEFCFDKKKRVWKDVETDSAILYEVEVKKIEAETGFSYDKWSQKWLDEDNNDIWLGECSHLQESIVDTFGINIADKNWQHWNGGVFLFDEQSHAFLDAWQKKTLIIFELENWKTRDQGTLIATVWEFGLNKHKTLSKKWNFIADYNKAGLDFKEEGIFTDDFGETEHCPALIHIYHHWGDTTWDVWNWIKKQR